MAQRRMLSVILLTIISSLFIEECFSLPARPLANQPVKGLSQDSSEKPPPAKGGLPSPSVQEKPITAVLSENLPPEPSPVISEEPEPAPALAEESKKEVDKNVPPKIQEPEKAAPTTEPPTTSTTPAPEEPKSKVLDGPIFKKGYPTTFYGPEGKLYRLPLSEAETEHLSNYGMSRRPKPRLHYIEFDVKPDTKKVRLVYFYMHIGNFLMYMGEDGAKGKDD